MDTMILNLILTAFSRNVNVSFFNKFSL